MANDSPYLLVANILANRSRLILVGSAVSFVRILATATVVFSAVVRLLATTTVFFSAVVRVMADMSTELLHRTLQSRHLRVALPVLLHPEGPCEPSDWP